MGRIASRPISQCYWHDEAVRLILGGVSVDVWHACFSLLSQSVLFKCEQYKSVERSVSTAASHHTDTQLEAAH